MQAAMDTWSRATLASVPEVGHRFAANFPGRQHPATQDVAKKGYDPQSNLMQFALQ